MIARLIASAAVAAVLAGASVSASHAAASDLDDCILDITFQCVDDDDFWGCYDGGVELCKNQSSAEIAVMPRGTLATIEKKAHQRAQTIFLKRPADR
jgi:hypothetical protein